MVRQTRTVPVETGMAVLSESDRQALVDEVKGEIADDLELETFDYKLEQRAREAEEEFGSGVAEEIEVRIYRLEAGKPNEYIEAMPKSQFSRDTIRNTYGGGTYQFVARFRNKILSRAVERIARPLLGMNSGPMAASAFTPDKMQEVLRGELGQIGQMFTTALDRMMQVVTQSQPKAKTTTELLQELQMMREIMGGNVAPSPPQDPYAILALATELAGKMSPQPNDENSLLMEGIKQFGPLLTNLAGGQQGPQGSSAQGLNNQPRVLPPLPPQPRPIPSQTMPANSSAPIIQPDEANMNMMINMYLKTLVANAQADNDPMTYAQAIMDFMGDDEAVKLANNPDWFKLLCERVPEAAPFEVWFNELREGIIYLTKPDEPGTPADIQNNDGAANAADPVPAGP